MKAKPYEKIKQDLEWLNCTCDTCGKRFHRVTGEINKAKRHYCSLSCRYPNREKPIERMCSLGEDCGCGGSEECKRCGFYLPEMERRLSLKLTLGPDGLLHINVAREGNVGHGVPQKTAQTE